MTTIKIPKGHTLVTGLKVDPGKGAVELAMQYVEEMTIEHVEAVCNDLVAGNFDKIDDKKVRRCQFCGYYYEDKTKNNSSLTCSDTCKTGKDIVLKTYRRKVKDDSKPKRPSYEQLYYFGRDTEYPHWSSEFHMFENDRKHGVYSYGDNFEEVVGKAILNAKMGGKKKKAQVIDYDGDEIVIPFAVKLSEKQHKTMVHKTIKRSATEIEADLLARYGAEKLAEERRRAHFFAKGEYSI